MHLKSAQSVNHDINMRNLTSRHVCLEVKFDFKKKIGNFSEASILVIFISMMQTKLDWMEIGLDSQKTANICFSDQSRINLKNASVNGPYICSYLVFICNMLFILCSFHFS
jgi:hypothetical protein